MRYLPLLVLLIGCAEAHNGAGGAAAFFSACEIGGIDDGYVWRELDGGTCGPFDRVATSVGPACNAPLFSCEPAGRVDCADGSGWAWTTRLDDAGVWQGRQTVRTATCVSEYSLTRWAESRTRRLADAANVIE